MIRSILKISSTSLLNPFCIMAFKKSNLSNINPFMFLIFLLAFGISCQNQTDELFRSAFSDSDGDGIEDREDSDPDNPCLPVQPTNYTGFNVFNQAWKNSDCDGDGTLNGLEFEQKRNPYLDDNTIDTDGDGVPDFKDLAPENPCFPKQDAGYIRFNSENELWATADCDQDGITNSDEFRSGSDPYVPCNLNFDIRNFTRELRTVDSNNGEGITIGSAGADCGAFTFSGGSIFNQGCFNDDILIPVVFTPNSPESSEGTISVEATTYSCLSEDRMSTRNFTVEGTGIYLGELGRIELNYTLITPNGLVEGILKIRSLSDPGDDDQGGGDDCNLDFDFSKFEGELSTSDSNNGQGKTVGSLLDSCNEISFGGDFLNLGCENENIEFLIFLDPFEEGGSEGNAIVENASFICISEGVETLYSFNTTNGYFNGDNGTIELEYSLSGGGNTTTGTVIIGSSGDNSNCIFGGAYNSIATIGEDQSFVDILIEKSGDSCNDFVIIGDFLNLGCTGEILLEFFIGSEANDGGEFEVILDSQTFNCTDESGSVITYTVNGVGNTLDNGSISLSEITVTDPDGNIINASLFLEKK